MITHARTSATTGLLFSGGLDSAILLAHLLEQDCCVQPFYVSTGCCWEADERRAIELFLTELGRAAIAPVVDLAMPVADLYGQHWSVTGLDAPDETTSDEAVALPGRNPLLLLKAILWCGQHGISRLALATLAGNPFADSTLQFVRLFEQAMTAATESSVKIIRPFAEKTKADILQLAAGLNLATGLPLHLTSSCVAPQNGLHCGSCNKCAERCSALQSLPAGDPTVYAAGASLMSS